MTDKVVLSALAKGAAKERLDREEALSIAKLGTPDDLHLLGEAAFRNRSKRFGENATYVVNQHINPSNICEGECGFCRYSARVGTNEGYVLEQEEILQKLEAAAPTEVHIVGGMNRIWDFAKSLELVRSIRALRPDIHIKAYTAVEIDWFARLEEVSPVRILQLFKDAGLDGLPGGGAELFSARMRKKYCPEKIGPDQWLEIHHQAHNLGIVTNATMLYGIGESSEERVDHLLALRDAQDATGGFSCFIPLAYQAAPGDQAQRQLYPGENLAVIALARLVLDNFDHIKAYWPMIGLETTSAGLSFGADDIDGTVGGERIAHAAGAKTPEEVTRDKMRETIRLGGFVPRERDGRFREIGQRGGGGGR